jgi:flagellar hook protein FlgE
MPSLYVPLTGLESASDALSVTSNNLANLNTIGFKSQRALFGDLFYQQIGTAGDGDATQIGLGANVQSVDSQFTEGSIQASGVPTDVAVQGDGFFVVQKDGSQLYTRAGDFTTDSNGNLLTQDGAQVLGYPTVNGIVSQSATLAPLTIAVGQSNPPNPTANVTLALNLDSGAVVGDTFSTPVSVFDSLGGSHVLTYTFTKIGSNAWNYAISLPAADTTTGTTAVTNGTLTFNGAGQLTVPAANVTGITIAGFTDGANDLTFNWNVLNPAGGANLTQVAGTSATSSTIQDGFASGALSSYLIGSDGTITGTFSNGQTAAIGQIALASFQNNQGLVRNGSNEFLSSLTSGEPSIGVPGSAGRGTLSGGSLEQSNVDLATQFAQLIIEERAYQANAKAVTTFDEVSQTAINLIP